MTRERRPLRIVGCHTYYPMYRLVAAWAERRGHEVPLVVTLPKRLRVPYQRRHSDLLQCLPDSQDALVTNRLATTAANVVRELQPDLIVSAVFGRLLPPELYEIPRLGAVNLHPAALPKGRGPAPQRLIFEGDDTMGATLHRVDASFDTGPLLSVRERPLPDLLSASRIMSGWIRMQVEVLDEGVRRLLHGEVGEPQDPSKASYAPSFTENERWLDVRRPVHVIQRRAAALNLYHPAAMVRLEERNYLVQDVREVVSSPYGESSTPPSPGTVLRWRGNWAEVQTGTGLARIETRDVRQDGWP